MTDVWADTLYQASFGGVEFDLLETEDSHVRSLVMHSYPRRDGGDGQDMGAEPRETTGVAIFWERSPVAGEDLRSSQNHLRRFKAWFAATQAGKPQEFVHPITGSYKAWARDVRWSAVGEERNKIIADVTFVEDTTEPAELVVQASIDAGVSAIGVAIDLVEEQLAAFSLNTTILDEMLIIIEDWELNFDLSLREVNLEVASISAAIDLDIQRFALESDIARHPLWKAYQRLHYQILRAADRFRRRQPQVIQIELRVAQPLRVIATDYYGARDAETRYQQILRLNEIDDPSLLPAGKRLKIPTPSGAQQASLRRAA